MKQCKWCDGLFWSDDKGAEECHFRCVWKNDACVMAFFVGLYQQAFHDELDDLADSFGWSHSERA